MRKTISSRRPMNETIRLKIEDLTREGDGVGRREDGKAVFVPGTLPGETVLAKTVEEKKTYAKAEPVRIVEPSKDRVKPLCPYAGECGGCALSHLSYEAELRLKEKWVRDALERIGGVTGAEYLPAVGADEPFRYRNKAELKIGPDGAVGYKKRRSNVVIDCRTCLLQTEAAERAADALRTYLAKENVRGLTGMTVRTTVPGDVMVVLETDARDLEAFGLPDLQGFADLLTDAIEADDRYAFRSFALSNGRETVTLAGTKTIRETACGLQWEISPRSFFQVNTAQTERLYGLVREFLFRPPFEGEAPLPAKPVLLDLYCGTGTIGLSLADRADRVLGIESVRPAVLDANRNAVINGIVNAEFLCGKAEEVLPEMFETAPLGGDDFRPCLVFPSGFAAP
ncbi:MAG: 23S rRNA (uracil(1939)-C(5))-methyltransferase RlmD, partial [Firmicutes bacterium]|nr:23S rRNA (uracil(1939)-C(5))-methyltransferase RlmD [Bacillota bacterium]